VGDQVWGVSNMSYVPWYPLNVHISRDVYAASFDRLDMLGAGVYYINMECTICFGCTRKTLCYSLLQLGDGVCDLTYIVNQANQAKNTQARSFQAQCRGLTRYSIHHDHTTARVYSNAWHRLAEVLLSDLTASRGEMEGCNQL